MDAGLDTGPIIQKKYFLLQEHTYIGEVYQWLEETIPQLFLDSAYKLRDGFVPIPQEGQGPFISVPIKNTPISVTLNPEIEIDNQNKKKF